MQKYTTFLLKWPQSLSFTQTSNLWMRQKQQIGNSWTLPPPHRQAWDRCRIFTILGHLTSATFNSSSIQQTPADSK